MQTEFTFAGFTFPRAVVMLPKGTPAARLAKRRTHGPSPCGPYITAPKPNSGRAWFFYLGSDFSPQRWSWADESQDARIRHTGWFTDDQYSETIRGLVVRLSHGFMLAGWSMGEGMASQVDCARVFDDEREAAHAADRLAELAAERERDHNAAESAYQCALDDAQQLRGDIRALVRDIRAQRQAGPMVAGICDRIRTQLVGLLGQYRSDMARMVEAREDLARLVARHGWA